jgi:hypothetical protein
MRELQSTPMKPIFPGGYPRSNPRQKSSAKTGIIDDAISPIDIKIARNILGTSCSPVSFAANEKL